jgi:AcrR family transcriptional regulator
VADEQLRLINCVACPFIRRPDSPANRLEEAEPCGAALKILSAVHTCGYAASMATDGLRARKKARTRQLIADSAARLFAEHGYENVAVRDVAREADVAEQTVYNYFPTKAQLVTDRDELVRQRFSELIRSRPAGVTPAAAVRDFILETPARIRNIPPDQWRGEIGYLAAISPTVHRLVLEMIDGQAGAVAKAIADSSELRPEIARLQGIALGSVFQIIIEETGRRTLDGQSQARIAKEVGRIAESLLDELERWFEASQR